MRIFWAIALLLSSLSIARADTVIELQDVEGKTVKISQEELRKRFEASLISNTEKFNRPYKNPDGSTIYQNPAVLYRGGFLPLAARKGFDVPGLSYLPGESARRDTSQGFCKMKGHESLVDWKAERTGKKKEALSLDPETGNIDSTISVDIHIKEIVCR